MSIAATIRRPLASFDHRPGRGDGQIMLMDAKSLIRSLGFPSRAHTHSRPIATIASAQASAGLIGNVPTPSTTNRPNSNPHNTIGHHWPGAKLPAVSSFKAYQPPTADPTDLTVFDE